VNTLPRFFIAAFEIFALLALLLGKVWFGSNLTNPNGVLLISLIVVLVSWFLAPEAMRVVSGVASALALAASVWKLVIVMRSGDDFPALVIVLLVTTIVVAHFLIAKNTRA
jgi:hypothetical protein